MGAMTNPTQDVAELLRLDRSGLPADGGTNYNRLVFENSPYLLQHATNPIDWFPWGEAAFAHAYERDRPILLSIGYSTCHWCHVMAHESFESDQVAEFVNDHFVAIKVDREERPDIDATYMAVCQLMTGGGGWPLTLLLTPEGKPFYAATYLPSRSRGGQIGLLELLDKVREMWRNDRDKLLQSSTQVVGALKQVEAGQALGGTPREALLQKALEQYRADYDHQWSGFGAAPKFPAPHNLELLLRLGHRFGAKDAQDMALETLAAIRQGGIYDQLGYGMHRYSVDRQWLVPHFEKMLYDQALLMLAATSAFRQSRNPFFAAISCETADYLLRDLRHPQGGFYCGEDADSEGREGTFYLWDDEELANDLGTDETSLAAEAFGVTRHGNFEGRNILTFSASLQELAARRGTSPTRLAEELEGIRKKLLAARERRVRPHRDEKLLTSWNGLAIAGLARTGVVCGKPGLVEAARNTADFVLGNLRGEKGRLLRRFCNGEAAVPAFLEDYAGLGFGLLELFLADFNGRWLQEAQGLAEGMLDLFDDGSGGLFDTGRDAEQIIVRGRNLQDGAQPSGISIASSLLLKLGRLTGRKDFERAAQSLLENHLGQAERYPRAFSWLLMTLDSYLDPEPTLVLAPGGGDDLVPWLKIIREKGLPELVLLVATEELRQLNLPLIKGRTALDGRTTAYYCAEQSCRPPVTDLAKLENLLSPTPAAP